MHAQETLTKSIYLSELELKPIMNTTARILADKIKQMNLPESSLRHILYQNEKMMNSLAYQNQSFPSMLDRLFQTITNHLITNNKESLDSKFDVRLSEEITPLIYLIMTHFKKESKEDSAHSQAQMSPSGEPNIYFLLYSLLLIDEEFNRFSILDLIDLNPSDLRQVIHPILSLFETSCLLIGTHASQKSNTLRRSVAFLKEELSKEKFSDLTNVYYSEDAMKRVLQIKPRFFHLDDFIQVQMEVKKRHEKDLEDARLESDQLALFERISSHILSSRINQLVFVYSFKDLGKLCKAKIEAAKRNMVSNVIDFLNKFCYEVISHCTEKSDVMEIEDTQYIEEYIELRQINKTRSKPVNQILTMHTYLQMIAELPPKFLQKTVLKKSFVWCLCQAFIAFTGEVLTMDTNEASIVRNLMDSELNLIVKLKELIAHTSGTAIRYCSYPLYPRNLELKRNKPSSI